MIWCQSLYLKICQSEKAQKGDKWPSIGTLFTFLFTAIVCPVVLSLQIVFGLHASC